MIPPDDYPSLVDEAVAAGTIGVRRARDNRPMTDLSYDADREVERLQLAIKDYRATIKRFDAEVERLCEALRRIEKYDVRVTMGATDATLMQDIAHDALEAIALNRTQTQGED